MTLKIILVCYVMKVLIIGGNGWIGEQFQTFFKKRDIEFIVSDYRINDETDYDELIDSILLNNVTNVLCLIGRTHGPGKPSIDYLESKDKLFENLMDNLYAPLRLASLCKESNIHFTYIGTGCIYQGYDIKKTSEDSLPNFTGSSYSVVKGFTDRMLQNEYNNSALNLRIRLPMDTVEHPRNLITKLVKYKKICSVPNSVTVLPTMIPIIISMMEAKTTGTFNMTNPGTITHDEILGLYKELKDPEHVWENTSPEEQIQMLQNERSNTHLNTSKLESLYPLVWEVKKAVKWCVDGYIAKL